MKLKYTDALTFVFSVNVFCCFTKGEPQDTYIIMYFIWFVKKKITPRLKPGGVRNL